MKDQLTENLSLKKNKGIKVIEYCFNYRKASQQTIINPDWNFNKMGIGGLDNEFSAIFRRAFASRVFPPEVVQQLGM